MYLRLAFNISPQASLKVCEEANTFTLHQYMLLWRFDHTISTENITLTPCHAEVIPKNVKFGSTWYLTIVLKL